MTDDIGGLYEKYRTERAFSASGNGLTFDAFRAFALSALDGAERIAVADTGAGNGFLYYTVEKENGCQVCDVPVFGVYAPSEKILSRLFCQLSEKVLAGGTTLFRVCFYAHDAEAQRLFSMMQFGYLSEKGILDIRTVSCPTDERWTVRTLSKGEIREHWTEVWEMTRGIIRHLRQPPVFYPGNEFTEEGYRAFYLDEGTSVHAAFAPDGKMIGLIESNTEPDWFVGTQYRSANVGEVYVVPPFRGSGVAQALLSYAAEYERKRGAALLWVEHGTANPNARAFWNRTFRTYRYEMVRKVEALGSL